MWLGKLSVSFIHLWNSAYKSVSNIYAAHLKWNKLRRTQQIDEGMT